MIFLSLQSSDSQIPKFPLASCHLGIPYPYIFQCEFPNPFFLTLAAIMVTYRLFRVLELRPLLRPSQGQSLGVELGNLCV